MKLKSIFTAILMGFASHCFAQVKGTAELFNDDFWKENPVLTNLSDEEKKSNAVYLADVNICKYDYGTFVDPRSGTIYDDVLIEENLYYKRIRLNNDNAVETFNKVYISMSNARNIINLKARAITKNGKVIEFDESNKKEVDNYENYGPFTIFALEGIEVGSEIEYTYTIKEPGSFNDFYFEVRVQDEFPKRHFHYELIVPENFLIKTKSYNGLNQMIDDTSATEVNRYILHLDEVDKFKDEDYSKGNALVQRVEIKLFELQNQNKRNFFSYNKAAKSFSKRIYEGNSEKDIKKEIKEIKSLVKREKWDKIIDEKEKIIAIEHYIKANLKRGRTGRYYIHEPIKQKVYSEQNAMRIYAGIFDFLKIDHQVVITCNRFEKQFDEDFETYSFLNASLFYFPEHNQYMAPTNDFMRFGLIPSVYAYNKGLFLKPIRAGGVRSFYPEIREIPGTNSDVNYDNMTLDIEFDEDFEKVKAHVKHEASGYSAVYTRPYMTVATEEQKEEILKASLKSFAEDAEITNITTKNEEMEGYMLTKPYIYEGDAESSSLIEQAGKKYLFKMGLVIGAQVEMYQDTSRQFDVENTYNHGYKRVLNIKIPDGYKITNLSDLNMDYSFSKDEINAMEFTSKYELNGNSLKVTCVEYYDEISVPLERYEEFRTVINAAADFNKITLVFEEE
tara:strand:+ start:1518 stop:3542 length:2025 start_codon:yes stop_codon:yes gene_type:complete